MLKYFIPPKDGFKPKTNYIVEVTFDKNHPIQIGILAVGYLNHKGLPSGPSSELIIQNTHGASCRKYDLAYYVKVLEEITTQPLSHTYISDIQNIFELEQHNIQRTQE